MALQGLSQREHLYEICDFVQLIFVLWWVRKMKGGAIPHRPALLWAKKGKLVK
jgi:hypothetical protein